MRKATLIKKHEVESHRQARRRVRPVVEPKRGVLTWLADRFTSKASAPTTRQQFAALFREDNSNE